MPSPDAPVHVEDSCLWGRITLSGTSTPGVPTEGASNLTTGGSAASGAAVCPGSVRATAPPTAAVGPAMLTSLTVQGPNGLDG